MPGPYPISVSGESFTNEDGTSRQAELARCLRGEEVRLERDPRNRHDANCIKVISARGIQVGNIARKHAEWLAEMIDSGGYCEALILGGGPARNGLIGIRLLLSIDEDNPPSVRRFDAGDYPWLDDQFDSEY